MPKIDIKTSAPMRALETAKVKYPDFFKAVDRIYKDPDAKWDKSICYCPVGLGVTYAVDLAGLDSPTLAERGEISRTGAPRWRSLPAGGRQRASTPWTRT